MTLSNDVKWVSNIYRLLLGRNKGILEDSAKKWNDKCNLEIDAFSLSRSFSKISMVDDIYLRYI